MTTNPSTQEAAAMAVTRPHILTARERSDLAAVLETMGLPRCPKCGNNHQVWANQITGLLTCHRAYCHTVVTPSEGTESARRINDPQRASLTPEPLLLATERLHRVDASQLPANTGVSLGHCRTDMGICMGHPECADRACQGHPFNDVDDGFDVPESERDGPLLLKVLAGYVLFLLGCGWCAWQLIQWLSR